MPDLRAAVTWEFVVGTEEVAPPTEVTAPFLLRSEPTLVRTLLGRTALIGRISELETVRAIFDQVRARSGRVVTIAGAQGVGKTRLAGETCAAAMHRGFVTLAGNCYDRNDSVPFVAFVEILEAALAQSPNPKAFRDALGDNAPDIARLMPQLRRIFPDIAPPPELSPEQSRRILFNAVVETLSRLAINAPLMLLLEDLHWADEGTLSLLIHIVRSIANLPIFLLTTYRDTEIEPEKLFAGTLNDLARIQLVQRINLRGLPESAVGEMIEAMSERKPPAATIRLFYSFTEGHPLFVEELFHHLAENGKLFDSSGEFRHDLTAASIDVPRSLRLIVVRRLLRISEGARKMLGTAAVIGNSFTFDILEAATGINPDALLDGVEEAEHAGLISSSLDHLEARFQFSHETIRQSVLAELSVARRQRLHLSVAEALEHVYVSMIEDHVTDLAHHLLQAGTAANANKTVRYLAAAAQRELQQSAYEAVLRDSQSALELLSKLPDTSERAQRELELQICRGVALMASRGWAVSATGDAYARARDLCEGLGDDSHLFSVLYGLSVFHLTRGEHPRALAVAEEMRSLATRLQDDGLQVQANWTIGSSQYFMGRFVEAHENLRRAISLYDPLRHQTLAFRFAQDPYVSSLVFEAATLWMLGCPDQGEASARAALVFARKLEYPFTLSWCIQELTCYYLTRRDFIGTARLIEEGVPLMREHGYSMLEESELALQLIALAAQGKIDEFIASSRRARKFSAIEYQIRQTWVRSTLAEALGKAGRFPTATSLLNEASELMDRNEERYVEPEIYRIRGELVLDRAEKESPSPAQVQEAEQHFIAAIESARCHGAKMLELRAATSLSRLLAQTGRAAEACRTLRETCAGLTEGFETPEFKTAQDLLRSHSQTQGSISNS
ncbi:MAG: AAA family ATPase [Candidatus Binatus sp.]